MTKQDITNKLHEMIENKCDEGFNRMKNMPVCEKFYNEMAGNGFAKLAETFKNIVFYTTILHPSWTDMDIFTDFAKKQGIL